MTKSITSCVGILLLLVLAACSSAAPVRTTPAQTPTSKPPAATMAAGASASPSPRQSQAGTAAATPKAAQTPTAPVVTADGRLSYVDHRGLTFGTSGQIAHINVNELDKVSKGQVLASLDATSLGQAVKTAEFGVMAADFTYRSATTDRKLAEAAVTSAQSDLKVMQANVKSAQIDLENVSNNLAKVSYPYTYATFIFNVPNAIAAIHDAQLKLDQARRGLNATPGSDEYLNALNQFKLAQDSLVSAQQNLQTGVPIENFGSIKSGNPGTVYAVGDLWTIQAAQLAVGKAQIAVENAQNSVDKTTLAIDNTRSALAKAQIAEDKAKSDVDRARNDLDKAKFALTQTIITAPFDGVVARVNSKELDLITAGNYASTIVVEIVDPRHMELDVKISELDVPKVKLGQKAIIRVDALPDQRVNAVVTSVASLPSVDSGVVSYLVKIVFDVPQDSSLKAGMAATADIGG